MGSGVEWWTSSRLKIPMENATNYLLRNGKAGRLSYVSYRRQELPLASRSIESSIRRVINFRIKSNAMIWRKTNASSLKQVRRLAMTERWDDRLEQLGRYRRSYRRTN